MLKEYIVKIYDNNSFISISFVLSHINYYRGCALCLWKETVG